MVEYLTICTVFPPENAYQNESASDNAQPSEIPESRINTGDSSLFASLQQIFCELWNAPNCAICKVICSWLRNIWQNLAAVFSLLGDRDPYRFLESVKAYLQWRIVSTRKRGVSWRNQPTEVSNLSHALNILNSLESSGLASANPERNQLFAELGREVELAKAEYYHQVNLASLPPKKPVRSASQEVAVWQGKHREKL